MFAALRRISLNRPITSYSKVRPIVSAFWRNRPRQWRVWPTYRYLQIGCGPCAAPGFLNIDYDWHPGVHVVWDAVKTAPVPERWFKGVFAEHVLEHVPYADGVRMLTEVRRLLIPGGTCRIVVPDAGLYLHLYARATDGESVQFPYQIEDLTTSMMQTAWTFQQHGHRAAYDFETLATVLRQAGFSHIEQTSFRMGRDPTLLIDREDRAVESLYVEAW